MSVQLIVLAAAGAAALAAALGVLPLTGDREVEESWLAWANALAGGLMLGTAFTLGVIDGVQALPTALGALAGLLFVAGTHRATGTEGMELVRLDAADPAYGYRVAIVQTLHSGAEGVAIGAAVAASVPFGLFTAATMAVHNVPEVTVLAAVQRSRGVSLSTAALAGVATNVPQVFTALATWAVIDAAPGVLPWALGLATGMLIYLVLVELLPESYREAGPTSIAVVTSVSMSVVALLMGWVIR